MFDMFAPGPEFHALHPTSTPSWIYVVISSALWFWLIVLALKEIVKVWLVVHARRRSSAQKLDRGFPLAVHWSATPFVFADQALGPVGLTCSFCRSTTSYGDDDHPPHVAATVATEREHTRLVALDLCI